MAHATVLLLGAADGTVATIPSGPGSVANDERYGLQYLDHLGRTVAR